MSNELNLKLKTPVTYLIISIHLALFYKKKVHLIGLTTLKINRVYSKSVVETICNFIEIQKDSNCNLLTPSLSSLLAD